MQSGDDLPDDAAQFSSLVRDFLDRNQLALWRPELDLERSALREEMLGTLPAERQASDLAGNSPDSVVNV